MKEKTTNLSRTSQSWKLMSTVASDALVEKAKKCCDISKKQIGSLVVTGMNAEDGKRILQERSGRI